MESIKEFEVTKDRNYTFKITVNDTIVSIIEENYNTNDGKDISNYQCTNLKIDEISTIKYQKITEETKRIYFLPFIIAIIFLIFGIISFATYSQFGTIEEFFIIPILFFVVGIIIIVVSIVGKKIKNETSVIQFINYRNCELYSKQIKLSKEQVSDLISTIREKQFNKE